MSAMMTAKEMVLAAKPKAVMLLLHLGSTSLMSLWN
jgi:hypothetical protein